tara:strand:- start:17 stop:397 length:381 start_codon:yes stop_codon:yes gene_type:complete
MRFTLEQERYILRLYKDTKGSTSTACKRFIEEFPGRSVSFVTIRGRWRNAGYKLRQSGGRNNGLSDDQIIALHGEYNGDIERMMESLGRKSSDALVDMCQKLDLPFINAPKRKSKRGSEPFPGYDV